MKRPKLSMRRPIERRASAPVPRIATEGIRLVLVIPEGLHAAFKAKAAAERLQMRELFMRLCADAGILAS